MKKILITGAGGFIGSYLTELLVHQGFDVKAFVRYNSKNNWGWLEYSNIKNDVEIVSGDIRDFDSVYNAVIGCDSIFHLAALIGIPYSYISPKAYIETNINGTYNVLQIGKQLGLEQILITSTSETYGTAQYVPIDENHPMVGQSPYSASKIAADQLAISYYRSYGIPIKIVRPFNTYGPRQSARAIIPVIITQILTGEKRLKIGNLKPTRDLTFIKDTCKGFFEIYKSGKLSGEIINIGSNQEISVEDLIFMIAEIMRKEVEIESEEVRIRPISSEVEKLRCNNTKLLNNTGWKPEYDLKSGLAETIKWFRNNINNYKADIYNI